MIDNQIIQVTPVQNMLYIFQKLTAGIPVYGIKQYRFLIQQQIGIIGYAIRNRVNIFKQGKTVIISSHPVQIVNYFSYTVHTTSSFSLFNPMSR